MLYELTFAERALKRLSFGLVFVALILWLGSTLIPQIEFQGFLSPLTDKFQEKIWHRYVKAALFILLSSIIWSFQAYFQDRRRMQ